MSAKLKPKSYVVDLVYACEFCGAERAESPKFTREIGKFLCGACDRTNKVEPIKSCKVVCEYSTASESVDYSNKLDDASVLHLHDAISLLVKMGYSKKSAKNKGQELYKKYVGEYDSIDDVEDFLKFVLSMIGGTLTERQRQVAPRS